MTEMKAIGRWHVGFPRKRKSSAHAAAGEVLCSEAPVANFNRKIQYPQLDIVSLNSHTRINAIFSAVCCPPATLRR